MYGQPAIASLRGVHCFVLTSNRKFEPGGSWKVAATPNAAMDMAAASGAKELVVSGGSTVNAAFATSGLVDRVILNVESVLIGRGIPLFPPGDFDVQLQFRDVKKLTSTVVRLYYDVVRD